MKILAFDLATETGVAFGDAEGTPSFLTESLGEPGAPHGKRFLACMNFTNRMIAKVSPDIIAIEAPIAGKKQKKAVSYMLIGLRANVMGVAEMRGVRCVEYEVSQIRKHFIDEGRLGRDVAKRRVMSRCSQVGWEVTNDNEGDAAALWDYTRAKMGFRSPLPLFGNGTEGAGNEQGETLSP